MVSNRKTRLNNMQIALIAHDGKKAEMVAFLMENREALDGINLISTGTTG
jgi:methylglyoxal synthase